VLLRGKAAVRQAYLDLFESFHFHSITPCVGSWPETWWWTIASRR
jgi:hypothetical protein